MFGYLQIGVVGLALTYHITTVTGLSSDLAKAKHDLVIAKIDTENCESKISRIKDDIKMKLFECKQDNIFDNLNKDLKELTNEIDYHKEDDNEIFSDTNGTITI